MKESCVGNGVHYKTFNMKSNKISLLFKIPVVLLEGLKEQQKEIDELKALVNSLITNQTAQVNK